MASRMFNLSITMLLLIVLQVSSVNSLVSTRMVTNKKSLKNLTGYYMPRSIVKVVLNNKIFSEFKVDISGQYDIKDIPLNEGENLIEFRDSRGIPIKTIIVTRDTKKPILTVSSRSEEDVHIDEQLEYIYKSNEKLKEITAKMPDGRFLQLLPMDREGTAYILRWKIPRDLKYNHEYQIPVIAIDNAGNISPISPIEFTINPRFEISSPKSDMVTSVPFIVLQGTLDTSLELFLNEKKLELRSDGSFYKNYDLAPSLNIIELTTKHESMKPVVKTFRIYYKGEYDDVSLKHSKDDIINVSALRYLDIISKSPDRKFRPDKPIKRAVLATWLIRSLNIEVEKPTTQFAGDVDIRSWRAPYIKEAINLGIMPLDNKGNFNPDAQILYEDGLKIFDSFKKVISRGKISQTLKKIKRMTFSIISSSAFAAEKESRKLTRIEAVRMLSSITKINRKIRQYVKSGGIREKEISATPQIQRVKVSPEVITRKQSRIYTIEVKIYDPRGLTNIKKVTADLSQIGQKDNQILVDNGKWGDNKLNDSVFSFQGYLNKKVLKGTKKIKIEVLNYDGIRLVTTMNMTIR